MEEIKKILASITRTFTYLFSSLGFIGLLIGDMRKAIDAGNADFISIYYRIIIESFFICCIGGITGILFGSGLSVICR